MRQFHRFFRWISLSDYHDECFYRELRGHRNQQKKIRYLGLIGQANFENVEYDTYTKEELMAFWVDSGWIYTADGNGIRRVNLANRKEEQLTGTAIAGECIAYDKGKLWCTDLQNRVYFLDIETGKTENLPVSKCRKLFVCGGTLYFQTFQGELGYYDESVHVIPDCTVSDTSNIAWDGEKIYYCNEKTVMCLCSG